MAEPSIGVAVAASAGITLLGVSTGLDPAVLIAGLAGGLWAQSYHPASSFLRRIPLIALSAIISGYLAPAVSALASSYIQIRMPDLKFPAALLIGLTSHRVLGPAFMKLAAKKMEVNSP